MKKMEDRRLSYGNETMSTTCWSCHPCTTVPGFVSSSGENQDMKFRHTDFFTSSDIPNKQNCIFSINFTFSLWSPPTAVDKASTKSFQDTESYSIQFCMTAYLINKYRTHFIIRHVPIRVMIRVVVIQAFCFKLLSFFQHFLSSRQFL